MKNAKFLLPVLMLGASVAPSLTSSAHAAPIKWQPSVDAALKVARRTGKPVFIDFYATWCGPCKILDKAYLRPDFQRAASRYVMVKVDVDRNQPIARKYRADSLPTMVFLNSRGKVVGRKIGFALERNVRTEKEVVAGAAKDVIKSMTYIRKTKI